MKIKITKNLGRGMRTAFVALFVIGSAIGIYSYGWYEQQTEQTQWYLAGRVAYVIGDDDSAVKDFDRSIAAYQSELTAERVGLSAHPSLEQAQLALFHKANALLKLGNGELALATFKDALRICSDLALSESGLSEAESSTIRQQRVDTETDIEIMLQANEKLAKGEGKGKGKPSDAEKKSEDPAKGDQAGKDPRDSL